jgi:glycosyltransferase involved in cell wall biosynthesis
MGKRNLLTVSGIIGPELADDVARGTRPRVDYLELSRTLDADIIDYGRAQREATFLGRIIGRLAGNNALLAWTCFRQSSRYAVVITDGEQVGLPYAMLTWLLRHRPRHAMIVHVMSVRKKVLMFVTCRLRSRVDQLLVYSTAQRRFAIGRLRMPATQVDLTAFMVDTEFFSPSAVVPSPRRMICAAGLEFRDYETLAAAVEGLDVEVSIAAASPWSKRTSDIGAGRTPDNITVCKLNLFDLRQLYADALFVVMPLVETDFQAGVTTILEAMSMGKAVVCSRTTGQTDVIIDDVTGIYVRPGDSAELRSAIRRLLDDRALADQIGSQGREWVVENADIGVYARRIADLVGDGRGTSYAGDGDSSA